MKLTEEELRKVAMMRKTFPSLEAFLEPMEPYFSFFPRFKSRLYRAVATAELDDSLRELQKRSILPRFDPTNFEKVTQLWESELFRVYLDAIGFAPPTHLALSDTLKEPVKDVVGFRQRCEFVEAQYGLMDHWESVLHKTCPELYLLPFLSADQLEGCDLACGWGRGAITVLLRTPDQKLHCCDASTESLEQLQAFAAREGVADRVETHSCFLPNIPLADDCLDFAVGFDIFELLPDNVLEPLLDDILRVCKLEAVLYFKITLNAFQPTLGQVQNLTPRKVRKLFEGRSVNGKSMRLELHHREASEHFTFRVVTTPKVESPSSAARSPAESRAARLSKLRRR
jgi:hypothetical protein